LQSGRPDADVDGVVGGGVGGRLKVTCHGAPAVTAAVRRQVVPAQRGVPCAVAWLVPYLPVSWLL
jgi:hypothetical protein